MAFSSTAGIFGVLAAVKTLPSSVGYWAVAAVVGGVVGSHLGSRRLANVTLRRLLAVVLVIVAIKFMVV